MPVTIENFQQWLTIEAGHDHIPTTRIKGFINQYQVIIENAQPLQAMTRHPHQVDLWAMQAIQLIQGNTLFEMILRRAGETGRNRRQKEWNRNRRRLDGTKDDYAVQGCTPTKNCI